MHLYCTLTCCAWQSQEAGKGAVCMQVECSGLSRNGHHMLGTQLVDVLLKAQVVQDGCIELTGLCRVYSHCVTAAYLWLYYVRNKYGEEWPGPVPAGAVPAGAGLLFHCIYPAVEWLLLLLMGGKSAKKTPLYTLLLSRCTRTYFTIITLILLSQRSVSLYVMLQHCDACNRISYITHVDHVSVTGNFSCWLVVSHSRSGR